MDIWADTNAYPFTEKDSNPRSNYWLFIRIRYNCNRHGLFCDEGEGSYGPLPGVRAVVRLLNFFA
jgi:hypothetical protein